MSEFVYKYVPGKRAETLLLLHGTGGNERDLLEVGAAVLPGAGLLSPRGQVLENGMPRFFRRFGEGVFDEADLKRRAGELGAFVREKAEEHGFDAERVIAVGYSNGANIAAGMLLTGAARFVRAVLIRAMVPLRPKTLPDLKGCEVLIAAGLYDGLGTPEHVDELMGLLERAGAQVTLSTVRAGHGMTHEDVEVAREWLARA